MEALIKLDSACKLLDEAKGVAEAQEFHNQAEAMKHYAQQKKLGCHAVNKAELLIIMAERKIGEMLKHHIRPKPGRKPSQLLTQEGAIPNGLPEGISWNQSSQFQRLCQIPMETLLNHAATCDEEGIEMTRANTLALLRPAKKKKEKGGISDVQEDFPRDPNKSIETFCRAMTKAYEEWAGQEIQKNNPWLRDRLDGARLKLRDFCNGLRSAKTDDQCPRCKGLGCHSCRNVGEVPHQTYMQLT